MLILKSLGQFAIILDGAAHRSRKDQRRVVFFLYLALNEEPILREDLARFLWPHAEESLQQSSLRTWLYRLRKDGYTPYLKITRQEIGLAPDAPFRCDLVELRNLLSAPEALDLDDLRKANELYRGPFLADMNLDNWIEAAEWADTIQYGLEIKMVLVWSSLIDRLLAQGMGAEALRVSERLINLAPYDDASRLLYLRSVAAAMQPEEALRRLNAYRQAMARNVKDWTAAPELEQFARQLAAPSQLPRSIETPVDPADAQLEMQDALDEPLAPAPDPPLNFIGRTREAALLETLLEQHVRLITIGGMGGIGKTTFVRSRLPALRQRFRNRLYYIDLRGQTPEEDSAAGAEATLLNTVATAVRINPTDKDPLFDQVRAALALHPACLVLDNFEVIRAGAAALVRLLEAIPGLTIIVTSRYLLNLKPETQLLLTGLSVDANWDSPNSTDDAPPYSEAAALFLDRAIRVQPKLAQSSTNAAQIDRLCRQLGGHPLAIELAALQLDFYGLDDLLTTVEVDLSLLGNSRSVQREEHSSLKMLLEKMWQTLSPAAARVLAEASVFTGRFCRNALEIIAPAPIEVYRELRTCALLLAEDEPGCFSLHPLVKQNAAKRLDRSSSAHSRHARFFLDLLTTTDQPQYPQAILEPERFHRIQRNQADIFVAWRWAVDHGAWYLLEKSVTDLGHYLFVSRQRSTGAQLLESLVDRLQAEGLHIPARKRLAGLAALLIGWLEANRVTGPGAAWREQAIAWLAEAGGPFEYATACAYHGRTLMMFAQQLERGLTLLRDAAALSAEHGFAEIQHSANTSLLFYHNYMGEWAEFRRLDEETRSLQAKIQTNDERVWFMCCYASLLLRHWSEATNRIDDYAASTRGRPDSTAQMTYIAEFRGYLRALQGDWGGAIAEMRANLAARLQYLPQTAPLAYGALALWQASAGDDGPARAAIAEALGVIEQMIAPEAVNQLGLLSIAAAQILIGEKEAAEARLAEVLRFGLTLPYAPLAFTALYHLAALHEAELPPALWQEILQRALVSPALHFAHYPLARARVDAAGIQVAEAEFAACWATDPATVKALAVQIGAHLPLVGKILEECQPALEAHGT